MSVGKVIEWQVWYLSGNTHLDGCWYANEDENRAKRRFAKWKQSVGGGLFELRVVIR